MIIPGTNLVKRKHVIVMICGTILLIMSYIQTFAQEHPPKPIEFIVTVEQHLNFGTFCNKNSDGEYIIIYPDGSRFYSDGIIPITGSNTSPLIYEVVAIPGTLITIVGQHLILSGNGGTMGLDIGLNISDSDPPSPFIATGTPYGVGGKFVKMVVRMGGKLTVGNYGANPAGDYSCVFSMTFNQQ